MFDFSIEHVWSERGTFQGVPATMYDVTFYCGCVVYCDTSGFPPEWVTCEAHDHATKA
jgi:hypothetical protein